MTIEVLIYFVLLFSFNLHYVEILWNAYTITVTNLYVCINGIPQRDGLFLFNFIMHTNEWYVDYLYQFDFLVVDLLYILLYLEKNFAF